MKPPYGITAQILDLIASISEKIGAVNAVHLYKPSPELRKRNRIRTIQSSLEIEGNTLSEEQITALIESKKVAGPKKDILEVQNAIVVYEQLSKFKVYSIASLFEAHALLMKGLIDSAGKIRSKSVGIVKNTAVAHIAPPATMVKPLLNNLFAYLKKDKDLLLIKSCVFHYKFEFIHPFADGNGRMGRLWQTLLLKEYAPVFEYLPIESIIKQRQDEYYKALSVSDKSGNSTAFIEFMLQVIDTALAELLKTQNTTLSGKDRMQLFHEKIGNATFTRQDYLHNLKEISSATASRDIKDAVSGGILNKSGDKRTSSYKFV